MPSNDEITDAILGAFDDAAEEEESEESEGAEPVDTTAETAPDRDETPSDEDDEEDEDEEPEVEVSAESETEEEGEEEPETEDGDETDEEEPSGEEEETSPAAETADADVEAFLARHQGDVGKALKTAANQALILARQGTEIGQLREHVASLDAQLQQASMFAETGIYLDAEQQAWVAQAQESGNQIGYIRAAVQAGEIGLARAVAEEWAVEDPYKAMRAAQLIDAAEMQLAGQEQGPAENGQPLNYQALFSILTEHYPEIPQFAEEMTATLAALGEGHPLAIQARSTDPGQAAQGIIGLYEIARAKSASVAQVRAEAKGAARKKADTARARAVVSSAQAGAQTRETPRTRELMPGLSMEAFEAELDRQ